MPVSPTESKQFHDLQNEQQAERFKTRVLIKQVSTRIGTIEDLIGAEEERLKSVKEVVFNEQESESKITIQISMRDYLRNK